MTTRQLTRATRGHGVPQTTRPVAPAAAVPPAVWMLVVAVGVLAAAAAVVGLVWRGSGDVVTVTTIRGETLELYGRGLYRWDTLFAVANNWTGNVVMLVLGLPLLAVASVWARRSLRGHLLLIGTLGFFLYMAASYALGAMAYNDLFLLHVAFFSAALWAFVLAFAALRPERLRIAADAPRRFLGGFMIVSGIATLGIWASEPVAALLSGAVPASLDAQTTLFTHALDIAVIAPVAIVGGALLWRRRPLGHPMAAALLVLEIALLPLIGIATVLQLRLGVTFTTAEIVGPVTGFVLLAAGAAVALVALLRSVTDAPEPARGRARRRAHEPAEGRPS